MRIVLILAALAAIAVVLWSSWKIDRRLFALVLVVVTLGAVFSGVGIWQTTEREWREIDPADIVLNITDARGMEAGIRLRGTLENRSGGRFSRLAARVTRLDCPDETDGQPSGTPPCSRVDEAELTLREHVRPGAEQPWSSMIRMPASALDEGTDWELEVLKAQGYAGRQGERLVP